ncbi:MAG TPA: hypothetical protein VF037_04470 [Gemmatimonadales bacterium]
MADDSSAELAFRDIAIVGGGCYGSFYAAQLERARARGRVTYRRLLIVDRNPRCRAAVEGDGDRTLVASEWADFFDEWLAAGAAEGDAIVPSPLMPHLMFDWLVRRARRRWPGRPVGAEPLAEEMRTPYDMAAPDGNRYASYADWLCPTHCIEPAICPMIRAPRTWDMSDALGELTRRIGATRSVAGPAILRCRHRTFGVGMFDAAEVLAADRLVADAGAPGRAVVIPVGTVSACHGAVGLLAIGASAGNEAGIFEAARAGGRGISGERSPYPGADEER